MKLFFDTETTGKANMRGRISDPCQPRIVQFAALLTDDDGTEVNMFSTIIKPDGWIIPDEAAAIHGITTEKANACGVPILSALSMFSMFCTSADTLIAHNLDFDHFVCRCEYDRAGKPPRVESLVQFCTMKTCTDICQLPGPYGFKWPKLQEAHKFFFGSEFDGAHDALADVRACARIFFHLKTLK